MSLAPSLRDKTLAVTQDAAHVCDADPSRGIDLSHSEQAVSKSAL